MALSYKVRFWKSEVYSGSRVTTYNVRWVVDNTRHKTGFRTLALAEGFRSNLVAAAHRGEPFDVESGLAASMYTDKEVGWFTFACRYVDAKWPQSSANYRRTIAEALVTITTALLAPGRSSEPANLRSALYVAFNSRRRAEGNLDPELASTLRWVERYSRPLVAITDRLVLRSVLEALTLRLDGQASAATVIQRKRAVLFNVLAFAVDANLLHTNPMKAMRWRGPKSSGAIDRRTVVSPLQARTLLEAVRVQRRSGPRLVAFFALLYYGGLRPEEAVNLRASNVDLPHHGWGELVLERAAPHAGREWTNSLEIRDERPLKHRAAGQTRTAPCPPELTALLHEHLEAYGIAPEDRLFSGERGGPLAGITYGRIWNQARRMAFTDSAYHSPLARRPYDLRHAAVSTWLSAGVPAAQAAEWAGHSVAVLLDVYAKCLDGQESVARQKVDALLRMDSRPSLALFESPSSEPFSPTGER